MQTAVTVHTEKEINESYRPCLSKGLIFLSGKRKDQEEISIFRDTGAMQTFLLAGKLQLFENTSCGSSLIMQVIEMGCVKFPLHCVHLQSELCTGFVRVSVKGVDFIVGNDLAGGCLLLKLLMNQMRFVS